MGGGERQNMLLLMKDVQFQLDGRGALGVGGFVQFVEKLEAAGQTGEIHW